MNTDKITVRAYEELCDHLPEEKRKKEFEMKLPVNSTVRDVSKKLGIPPEEIHLVLVNGKNSLLDTKLHPGDRISLYPIFESIDISPIKIL